MFDPDASFLLVLARNPVQSNKFEQSGLLRRPGSDTPNGVERDTEVLAVSGSDLARERARRRSKRHRSSLSQCSSARQARWQMALALPGFYRKSLSVKYREGSSPDPPQQSRIPRFRERNHMTIRTAAGRSGSEPTKRTAPFMTNAMRRETTACSGATAVQNSCPRRYLYASCNMGCGPEQDAVILRSAQSGPMRRPGTEFLTVRV